VLSGWWVSRVAFANRVFATEMAAAVGLVLVMVLAMRMEERGRRVVTGGALLLLNGVLLVAMVREIGIALRGEAADFGVSGWMLVQGAAMMVAGFWKREAMVRWVGLALLAATVVKAFAYDMRGFGTGYRVLSALGLGVVLMAVSFAYQKDWLGLKDQSGEGA